MRHLISRVIWRVFLSTTLLTSFSRLLKCSASWCFVILKLQQAQPCMMTHRLNINQCFIQAEVIYSGFAMGVCHTTLQAVCFSPFKPVDKMTASFLQLHLYKKIKQCQWTLPGTGDWLSLPLNSMFNSLGWTQWLCMPTPAVLPPLGSNLCSSSLGPFVRHGCSSSARPAVGPAQLLVSSLQLSRLLLIRQLKI